MIDISAEYTLVLESYREMDSILQWSDHTLFQGEAVVSNWSPAQQLHHIAKVNLVIASSLITMSQKPEEEDSDRRASITGVSVLATGYIPRGRGKSPGRLRPPADLTRDQLTSALNKSESAVGEVGVLLGLLQSRKGRIEHPHFGFMRPSQWIRFMNVHTNHHLKIVRDIDRERRS